VKKCHISEFRPKIGNPADGARNSFWTSNTKEH